MDTTKTKFDWNNPLHSAESHDLATKGLTVPHNADVEAGLLGAVLRDNDFYYEVSWITAGMFYMPAHARLWEIITDQINTGNTATPVTLKHRADKIPEIEALGGGIYLARLTFEEFAIISPLRYADILRDLYQKRQIIKICQNSIIQAYDVDNEQEARDICAQTEQHLFDLETDPGKTSIASLSGASQSAMEHITQIYNKEAHAGVNTGFQSLNNVMGGLKPSDLLILAARPGMGKTALAVSIATNAALNFHKNGVDKSVLFFSLEMSAQQLTMRILSDKANIMHEKLRVGNLTKDNYDNYRHAAKTISQYPLFIEENPGVTIVEMRSIIRRLSRKKPVGAVFLDYLQLMTPTKSRPNDNRVNQLSEITRGLKLLAREFDVPIVALSQLSRQVENRENKTPNLADLRDSGSIEQDADVVMFIYRPEYYLKAPERKEDEAPEAFRERQERFEQNQINFQGKAKVIIAKNRHGSPTAVEMMFIKEMIRFTDPPTDRYDNTPHV